MTPNKLNAKWWARIRAMDERAEEMGDGDYYEDNPTYQTISEFLTDIEFLTVEQTPEEIENRAFIAEAAESLRAEIKRTGKKIVIDLSDDTDLNPKELFPVAYVEQLKYNIESDRNKYEELQEKLDNLREVGWCVITSIQDRDDRKYLKDELNIDKDEEQ